ncbi:ribose-5-phosphate isomerase RpiA [Buchnera aphidicola (Chaitoregma tattakana)]|uniref:ribose-5-phosphate isomerase RpiA n=1 Tax=Buchnera aphidicola TaxID=9 RepID=UPI0031B8937A
MNIKKMKKMSSIAALKYITYDSVIGIGTGSTVLTFIKELKKNTHIIRGVVSSSNISSFYLKKYNIKTFNARDIDRLEVYIDGADEINSEMHMIKGGGGALTGEKILAGMSKTFICIADFTKKVKLLGISKPIPIEIISIAYSFVKKKIIELGGYPVLRKNFLTDYNNIIIDVYNIIINDPIKLERKINSIPGVVTVGIFSVRKADIALIANEHSIEIIKS